MKAQDDVQRFYQSITSLDEYAVPLLQQKLQDTHQLSVDVRKAQIRLKVTLPAVLAKLLNKPVEQEFQHSLLQACLHNFSEGEASSMPGAQILDAEGKPLALAPEAFATLCRTLDIGKRYQCYLRAKFEKFEDQAGTDDCEIDASYLKAKPTASNDKRDEIHHVIEEGYRTMLEATVRLATLKEELSEHTQEQFLAMLSSLQADSADPQKAESEHSLTPKAFRVFGKQVRGAMAFEVHRAGQKDTNPQGVLCWIPGDSQGAICWYENWDVLFATLGRQFHLPGYDSFFQRFIGEQDRLAFTQALQAAKGRGAEHLPVELDGRHEALTLPLFEHMRNLQISTMMENALQLAAPTANRDSVERDQRLHFYLDLGLSALGLASLFVPWLGVPLLLVMAYEVVDGVYEGYCDWSLGDRQGALEHMMGAAENVILLGVGGGTGIAARRVMKSAGIVRRLVPVPINDGTLRLIHPELPGYEVLDDQLAFGERSSESGEMRMRLNTGSYRVEEDAETGQMRILHPSRADAYQPRLEDNGAGGWRHEFEVPQDGEDEAVFFQRLGGAMSDVPATTVTAALQDTGFDTRALRRLYLTDAAPPARLLDALDRHQLHEREPQLAGDAFESALQALQPAQQSAAGVLRRAFPGLTVRVAEEIIARADPAQVQRMLVQQKVPMALAGEARWYLRDCRIDRACAGLRQPLAVSTDSVRLALGLLSDMAPWPVTERIEIREGSRTGKLVAQTAGQTASNVRLIVSNGRGYMPYDANGALLSNDVNGLDLPSALLAQLGGEQKQLLGSRELTSTQLADTLSQLAFKHRDKVAALLGMASLDNAWRPPTRLADGRVGYRLSSGAGDPIMAEGIPPDIDELEFPDSLQQGIDLLLPGASDEVRQTIVQQLTAANNDVAWAAYSDLVKQVKALRRSLSRWAQGDRARQRAAQMVLEQWRPGRAGSMTFTQQFDLAFDNEAVDALPEFALDVDWDGVGSLSLRNFNVAAIDVPLRGRFNRLRRLELINCRLDTVPDWLYDSSELVHLSLRGNSLGTIPRQITMLPRLRVLDVSFNRLTSIDAGLDGAGALALQVLNVSHNPLVSLPSLAQSISLQEVNANFCQIRTFPTGLMRQHPGMRLLLDHNRISLLDDDAVRLIRLWRPRIGLHDNSMPMQVRGSIDLLGGQSLVTEGETTNEQMVQLQLRLSPLTRSMPTVQQQRFLNDVSAQLTALQSNFERWQSGSPGRSAIARQIIAGWIPEQVDNLPVAGANLLTLTLDGEAVGALLELPDFVPWQQFESLSLRNFTASSGNFALPGQFENLQSLEMFNCPQVVQTTDFSTMPRLRALVLSNNQLESLPQSLMGAMPELRRLVLSNNHLTEFPISLLRLNPELNLALDNNRVSQVDADAEADIIRNQVRVTYRGNPVFRTLQDSQAAVMAPSEQVVEQILDRALHFSPAAEENVRRQTRLLRESLQDWCSDNLDRRIVAARVFNNWQPATLDHRPFGRGRFSLSLDGRGMGSLPALPADVDFSRWTFLSLRNFRLSHDAVSFFTRFDNLHTLQLIDCGLREVPSWIFNRQSLVNLSLRDNLLSTVPNEIRNLSRLNVLSLNGNRLDAIPSAVNTFRQLRLLNLANNRIRSIGAELNLPQLQEVDLSGNQLASIPVFAQSPELRQVSASGCGLTAFPDALLRQHPTLRLQLDGNRIGHLSDQVIPLIQANRPDINLNFNPLSADALEQLGEPAPMSAPADPKPIEETTSDGPMSQRQVGEPYLEGWLEGLNNQDRQLREAQLSRLAREEGAGSLLAVLDGLARLPEPDEVAAQLRIRGWRLLDACELNTGIRNAVFDAAGRLSGTADYAQWLEQLEEICWAEAWEVGRAPEDMQGAYLQFGRELYRRHQAGAGIIEAPGSPEQPEALAVFLTGRGFWQAFLRRRFADSFHTLATRYANRLADVRAQGGRDINLNLARLVRMQREQERQLYLELTLDLYGSETVG